MPLSPRVGAPVVKDHLTAGDLWLTQPSRVFGHGSEGGRVMGWMVMWTCGLCGYLLARAAPMAWNVMISVVTVQVTPSVGTFLVPR
jgi:hypothetical protein